MAQGAPGGDTGSAIVNVLPSPGLDENVTVPACASTNRRTTARLVFVFVDKNATPMPRDATHAARWDYDATANEVTFYGADCTSLKDGKVSDVQIVFGCPGGPPPQAPVK